MPLAWQTKTDNESTIKDSLLFQTNEDQTITSIAVDGYVCAIDNARADNKHLDCVWR